LTIRPWRFLCATLTIIQRDTLVIRQCMSCGFSKEGKSNQNQLKPFAKLNQYSSLTVYSKK